MSNQNWRTPPDFLQALALRYGPIEFDLAATPGAQVTGADGLFFSPEQDSLKQDWSLRSVEEELGYALKVAFCNPPFENLEPWVEKLAECRNFRRWTIMIAPASIDAHWFEHVRNRVQVDGINRIKFAGAPAGFPKPLICMAAGFGVNGFGFWNWRRDLKAYRNSLKPPKAPRVRKKAA